MFEGHPIINDGDNKILIDTGAPSTIHFSDTLSFCLENYVCSTNYLGLTVSKISEMLGTEIKTLLGADILTHYKILLDYKNQVTGFSKHEIDIEGTQIDIYNFMGIPIIEMTIDNQKLKFFLDTGAKLSYLSDSLTRNYESVGTDEDFYPGVGKFQTDCYEIPTSFGDNKFVVRYGNLPKLLQMTLRLGGTDGIIGFDFFNNFKIVLDLKNNKLKYSK
ncbi:MAG: retroviral-like aspartic protease family protein [Ignavibacteria bacterium]|nr:retroviral-like aspartic protease family protein [Ignavibacteria bacterium]